MTALLNVNLLIKKTFYIIEVSCPYLHLNIISLLEHFPGTFNMVDTLHYFIIIAHGIITNSLQRSRYYSDVNIHK